MHPSYQDIVMPEVVPNKIVHLSLLYRLLLIGVQVDLCRMLKIKVNVDLVGHSQQ
jgi:hypothetical protein